MAVLVTRALLDAITARAQRAEAECDKLRMDLAEERQRYERLVESLTALKRSGFESAPASPRFEAKDDLPAVIRTAIADRGGDSFLEAYAVQQLAQGATAEDVAKDIYEGDDR